MLSLKYSGEKAKNPLSALREFFGKYHDPQWDEMEALKEEILILNHENPKLFERVLMLEEELRIAKRNQRFSNIFSQFDLDKNVII